MKTKDIEYIIAILTIIIITFISLTERVQATPSNETEMIPMRDGIKLATDLYFPKDGNGPFPVILMRTPYNKIFLKDMATILQDTVMFLLHRMYGEDLNPRGIGNHLSMKEKMDMIPSSGWQSKNGRPVKLECMEDHILDRCSLRLPY